MDGWVGGWVGGRVAAPVGRLHRVRHEDGSEEDC